MTCLYQPNATIEVVKDGVFTGERDPVTCRPIFTTQKLELPIFLERLDNPLDTTPGVALSEFDVRGRLRVVEGIKSQATYKCVLQTGLGHVQGELYLEIEPLSVMRLESYFGVKVKGRFKRSR